MPLDKAIAHGKEKRKPYRGSKAFDGTCRNHGTCKWCEENRKHKFRDKKPKEGDSMGSDGKDCKWYENDFCVNADCPICADWCPFNSVEAQAAVCRFYEPKEGA